MQKHAHAIAIRVALISWTWPQNIWIVIYLQVKEKKIVTVILTNLYFIKHNLSPVYVWSNEQRSSKNRNGGL